MLCVSLEVRVLYVVAKGCHIMQQGDIVLLASDIIFVLGCAQGSLHVMPTEQCVTLECCTRAAGDWMCNSCGQHNFRSRAECYKCAAPKCVLRFSAAWLF